MVSLGRFVPGLAHLGCSTHSTKVSNRLSAVQPRELIPLAQAALTLSPLQYAISMNHDVVVIVRTGSREDHGAEVNLRDCDGFTPLALLSKTPCWKA